jgi:hypothetical protein
MRARWIGIGAAAMALAAGACRGDSQGGGEDLRPTVAELPATPNRDLDLLFVIDDSIGMFEKQTDLAASLPALVERLEAVPGGLPNLHVGVVSTDMGTQASDSPTPAPPIGQLGQNGCSGTGKGGALQLGYIPAPVTGPYLIDVEGTGGRTRNYTGDLAAAIGQMVRLGGAGCEIEQPLAALRAALDNHPSNAGFLRRDALLGVIFLGDEDDCSATIPQLFDPNAQTLGLPVSFRCTRYGVACAEGGQTPDEMAQVGAKAGCGSSSTSQLINDVAPYRDFLVGLKADARRVAAAGILGPLGPGETLSVEERVSVSGAPVPALTHACIYMGPNGGDAVNPAARMRDLLGRFPDRGRFTSICGPDHETGLVEIAELLRRMIGTGCVEAPLVDVDAAPGLQADCAVEDVLGEQVTPIAPCEASPDARPCWRLVEDLARCAAAPAPHLALDVARDGAPDPATVTRVRCAVAP